MPVNVSIIQLLSEKLTEYIDGIKCKWKNSTLLQILFTYYFTHFILFVSILLRISVLSQFHNKFTIRSAKEGILICQRKKVFFFNHFRAINYVL